MNDDNEEYSICPLCSEKLLLSSELYQTICETQKLLREQTTKVEYLFEQENLNESVDAETEIKVEKEEEEYLEVGALAPVETKKTSRKARSIAKATKKVEKRVKQPIIVDNLTNKAQMAQEDQQLSTFFHLACADCSIQFTKFATYKSHMKKQHKVPQPVVVCCNLRLNKRCRILEHMIFHTDPAQFRCPDCGKQFQGKDKMERHRKQLHLPREMLKHQCDKCPKRFISLNNLKAHLHTHLTEEEKEAMKTHICADCGNGYKSKSLLAQHMRKIHLKLYVCICDICARTFNSKNDFLYHYASTHQQTTMPKVQCNICHSYLLNEKCLKSHIARIHKHGGPHICKICGKVSPSSQALRSHQIYVHERERKFKCPHCEKAFKREVGLKEHLTTHVGGALYTCQFCDKTFNSGANMYSHRKRAHPVEHERLMQDKLNEKKPDNVS